MARLRRITAPGVVYHVFNRAAKHSQLFDSPWDYKDFETLLMRARQRTPVGIIAYCLMPTHWHLLLRPHSSKALSLFVGWLTTTHAVRWNKSRGLTGRGAVYQSRFKSIPVFDTGH